MAAGEDDITLLKEEMDKMYKEMVQHAGEERVEGKGGEERREE